MTTRRFVAGAALAWVAVVGLAGPSAAQPSGQADALTESLQNTLGRAFRVTDARVQRDTDAGSSDLFTLENTTPGALPGYVNIESTALARLSWAPKSHGRLFAAGGPLHCADPLVECPLAGIDAAAFRNGAVAVHYDLGAPLPAATTGSGVFNLAVLSRDPSIPTAPDPRPNSPFVGTNVAFRFDGTANGWDERALRLANSQFAPAPTNNVVLRRDPRNPDQGWIFISDGNFATSFPVYDLHTFYREGTLSGADAVGQIPRGSLLTIDPSSTARIGLAGTPTVVGTGSSGGISTTGVGLIVGGVAIGLVGGGLLWHARRNAGGDTLPPATIATLQRQFGGAAEAEAAFTSALLAEAPIQRRLLGQYVNVATPWANAQQRFATATLSYAEHYQTTLRGSTELQELAQHWAEARGAAQWVDLAYGLATLGPAAVRLGAGGLRRLKGLIGIADDTATAAARAAARNVINESTYLRSLAAEADEAAARVGSQYVASDVLEECVMLADEAGVAVEDFVRARVDATRNAYEALRAAGSAGPKEGATWLDIAFSKAWCDLAETVMKQRGWTELPADVGNVMSDAIGGLHLALRGDFGLGQSARLHDTFTRLAQLAEQRPNFWEWIGKTYEMVGGPTSWDVYITPAFTNADLAMARWASDMLAAGRKVDELPGLWAQHVGPIASTGLQTAQGVGITVNSGVDQLGPNAFGGAGSGTGLVGTSTDYLDKFGIISPTFLFWDAGDSTAAYFGFNVLNFYLGPAEWMTNAWSTVEAMDAYSYFLDRYEGDITAMSTAAVDVLGSVDALGDVLLGPGISADDRRQLRDVRDTLQQSYDASSDEFKATNAAVLSERAAHIDQKLRQLDAVAAALTTGAATLIAARDAIATQVRGGRSGVAWIDPDVAMAFARTSLLVQSLASGILGTRALASPTSAPSEERFPDVVRPGPEEAFERQQARMNAVRDIPEGQDPETVVPQDVDAARQQQQENAETLRRMERERGH